MTATPFVIHEDNLTGEATRGLLALHLAGMRSDSPPGHSFALDLSGLQQPNITVWSVWRGGDLAAVGALKDLRRGKGELKSMRTHPDFLRQGAGGALLDFLIAEARRRSFATLSLETGRGPAFEAALALYASRGFEPGRAFGGYEASPFNQFLHLKL